VSSFLLYMLNPTYPPTRHLPPPAAPLPPPPKNTGDPVCGHEEPRHQPTP
jgi:hypothetical protein